MLQSGGWIVLAWQTDNPGAWLFHCHIVCVTIILYEVIELMSDCRPGILTKDWASSFLRQLTRFRVLVRLAATLIASALLGRITIPLMQHI